MVTTATTYHVPVLLRESIGGLGIRPGGVYVDVTFGGGGHSREILSHLDSSGHLYSFDQDADAEGNIFRRETDASHEAGSGARGERMAEGGGTDAEVCRITEDSASPVHARRTPEDGNPSSPANFTFVRSNFRYLKNWMRYYGVEHIDGLLADLGVSSHHLDDETRGFSFRFDAPLDMRMNKRGGMTAADIVNGYDEERLADIIYLYGELKTSRRIAAAIVKARAQKPLTTTGELLEAIAPLFRREREKKDMAKLFQALRIEVNHEMDALREMLAAATELLAPGGRLSVITYHSLEDRIVKNVMKSGNAEGRISQDFFGRTETPFLLVNSKVIVPDDDEQQRNPRSRSAKLRIAERI